MALLFLYLAVLEDSGYMARAAVVTDRLMRAIGLPGKAFIPIPVGAAAQDSSWGEAPAPEDSAYGAVAHAIAPAFAPAGFDSWSLAGPLVTGFVAKEALISRGRRPMPSTTSPTPLRRSNPIARSAITCAPTSRKLPAVIPSPQCGPTCSSCWLIPPCVATIAAQRREIGWRWTLFGFGVQLVTAWVLAVGAFQILKVFI